MAENKTRPTSKSVASYLENIQEEGRRADCKVLTSMMEQLTGAKPKMWGESIVGFGDYHYTYASGREGDCFLSGFSNRKQSLNLYITGYLEFYTDIMDGVGKFKHWEGGMYFNRLSDVLL